jgi:chemotaxis response regulator CheB
MGLLNPVNNGLRVAILSRSVRERDCLSEILETNSLQVVDDELFKQSLEAGNDQSVADVILVNLDDSDDAELDTLLDQAELPMLFNDSASIRKQVTAGGRAWGRRLAEKLVEAAGEKFSVQSADVEEAETPYTVADNETESISLQPLNLASAESFNESENATRIVEPQKSPVPFKDMPTGEIIALNKDGSLDAIVNRARRIWVLGASIGGPQAVKQFLARLPKDLPVCFILAQHIGVGFVNLLAEQLSRVTNLKVTTPDDGMVLEKGHLVVAPVDKRINFSERGVISMEDIKQRSIYSPSIDDVMTVVAKHYGADANAIIFSGMGNDGTAGCHLIAQKGGMVWAQEPKSCVISSMADSVRYADIVSLSATPEELADNLVEYLEGESN